MPVRAITSRDNPVYRELLALAESRQARRAAGRTLLDGEHLIDDAFAAGLAPVQFIYSEEAFDSRGWSERWPKAPAIQLPDKLFRKLSPVATPSGALAVIDTPRPSARRQEGGLVVMLEEVQEPGNLGALLRTSAAAGANAVYLSKGCAEAWSPKALRGGQGGHFRLDIFEGVALEQAIREFDGPVYAAALGSERSLYELALTGNVGFLFGNEGAGLSDVLLNLAEPFSIPMPGAVESLNVAAAAAVCLFERARQCRSEGVTS